MTIRPITFLNKLVELGNYMRIFQSGNPGIGGRSIPGSKLRL